MQCGNCCNHVDELKPVMISNRFFGYACSECHANYPTDILAVRVSENILSKRELTAIDQADANQYCPMGGGGENT